MKNLNKKQKMTNWFSISVLIGVFRRVFISSIFGEYADRRLIQAALNPIDETDYDFTNIIKPNNKNEIWIDYVADVGDGFNSTYSIAYLLAKKEITLDNTSLPRGNILIMGGDAVYPSATKKNYKLRMEEPYKYAFPDSKINGADHPLVFILPGNHDWYDGLTIFLAKFCQGSGLNREGYTFVGSSWRRHQRRSYFAIKLPDNWWIWGLDTQLTEDVDQPQADYFKHIISKENKEDKQKIIICSSEPTWLCTDVKDESDDCSFAKGIDYVATNIIQKNWPNAEVYAAISGDSHHYNRYKADISITQFITAGGGGAFLHPTHQLKENMQLNWFNKKFTNLHLASCYPDKCKSRMLSLLNCKFWITNWDFCIFLGCMYAIIALIFTIYRSDFLITKNTNFAWFKTITLSIVTSPIFFVLALIFLFTFYQYTDKAAPKLKRFFLGITHGCSHLLWVVILISSLPPLLTWLSSLFCMPTIVDWYPRSWLLFPLLVGMVLGGFIGGWIWGLYLIITSFFFALHSNDAFSAMRLDSYKNFLRIKLQGDTMTIYPVGIDQPIKSWIKNTNAQKDNQNEPIWLPTSDFKFHLIEDPIQIKK